MSLPFEPVAAEPDDNEVKFKLAGLSCLVVGGLSGLASDFAVYLRHGGAQVEYARDFNEARKRLGSCHPGQWIVVIDTEGTRYSLDEL